MDVSLRQWLDTPGRAVELPEGLQIFRQVCEAVRVAHSQGVVVENVRPSCFVMSEFSRVPSSGCSSSSDGNTMLVVHELNSDVSVKQMLVMEFEWYVSPEETAGEPGSFASDVYRLGVLLFELFSGFCSMNEKIKTMSNLRHRVLPSQLLRDRPNVSSFCLWLLHPRPNSRPKMSEVLESELLNENMGNSDKLETSIHLKEKPEEHELLLDFLLQLKQRKQQTADKLRDTICFLSSDMEDVISQQSVLKKEGACHSELEKDDYATSNKFAESLSCPLISEESCSRSGLFLQCPNDNEGTHNEVIIRNPRFETIQDEIVSKSSRLMKNFEKLQSAYLSTRYTHISKNTPVVSTGRGSNTGTEQSSVSDLAFQGSHNKGRKSDWINPFLESLGKYLSYSKLELKADLKQGNLLNSSNLVCALDFDRDKEFFAAALVNKKIKVFDIEAILNEDNDIHYPVAEMASRSRLSSICWNKCIKSQIASSDFEGVVQVWDATRRQVLSELREHQRRVWSIDFSRSDPTKLASGSDDGTVKLWNINQAILVLLHLLQEALALSKQRQMYVRFSSNLTLVDHLQSAQLIIIFIATIFVT